LFISGFDVKCDESSLTGETDAAPKSLKAPYLVSGTKVLQGVCNILVIGTGINSLNGRILSELNVVSEDTPLQIQLSLLADKIAKIGVSSAFAMIVIILTAYLSATGGVGEKLSDDIINIVVTGITVIVVAIPEGLPLAVTLALAYDFVFLLLVTRHYRCSRITILFEIWLLVRQWATQLLSVLIRLARSHKTR
jgi:Ca2+-transporting ATPase